jgi:hypothetical protein
LPQVVADQINCYPESWPAHAWLAEGPSNASLAVSGGRREERQDKTQRVE